MSKARLRHHPKSASRWKTRLRRRNNRCPEAKTTTKKTRSKPHGHRITFSSGTFVFLFVFVCTTVNKTCKYVHVHICIQTKLKDFKLLPAEVQKEYRDAKADEGPGKRRKLYTIVNKYVARGTERG